MNSEKKLEGLGRKVTLKPKYFGDTPIDFEEDATYIEEGQFRNDVLDNAFGRRIYIKENAYRGWFSKEGDKLHGYGHDRKSD